MNYKQRVLIEYKELTIRVNKLSNYLEQPLDISKEEVELLNQQLTYMIQYQETLEKRIYLMLEK